MKNSNGNNMKAFHIWIVLTAWACTAFSQALSPKVIQQNGDTLFCFSLSQSRAIAKHLIAGQYCDSLLVLSEQRVGQLVRLNTIADSSILGLTKKSFNQDLMLRNQGREITELNLRLTQSDKKFKAERWQKYLFLVSTVALGTWLLSKH